MVLLKPLIWLSTSSLLGKLLESLLPFAVSGSKRLPISVEKIFTQENHPPRDSKSDTILLFPSYNVSPRIILTAFLNVPLPITPNINATHPISISTISRSPISTNSLNAHKYNSETAHNIPITQSLLITAIHKYYTPPPCHPPVVAMATKPPCSRISLSPRSPTNRRVNLRPTDLWRVQRIQSNEPKGTAMTTLIHQCNDA